MPRKTLSTLLIASLLISLPGAACWQAAAATLQSKPGRLSLVNRIASGYRTSLQRLGLISPRFDKAAALATAPKEMTPATVNFDGVARLNSIPLHVYLVQHGQTVQTTLSQLGETVPQSGFLQPFNRTNWRGKTQGHVRIILNGDKTSAAGLSEGDQAGILSALEQAGLSTNNSRTDWIVAATPTATASQTARRPSSPVKLRAAIGLGAAVTLLVTTGFANPFAAALLGVLVGYGDRIAAELAYSLRTLQASSRTPTREEIAGGVIGKIIPAVINIGVFAVMFSPDPGAAFSANGFFHAPIQTVVELAALIPKGFAAHPVALASMIGVSLAVETFHGVWVNTWDNFQSKIGQVRGAIYQQAFNFLYGNLVILGIYRAISYFALGNVDPPWTWAYWQALLGLTIIGTVCGTLGYRGLNSLYEKGRISRRTRAAFQQGRDFIGMTIGPMFSTGNMIATYILFAAMQAVDLALFAVNHWLKTQPIVYIADASVASSKAFHDSYLNPRSPVQQAGHALKSLLSPLASLYRRFTSGS